MIPATHVGTFRGTNRLWLEGPEPERCDGVIEAQPTSLVVRWSFRGAAQEGTITLAGPPGAMRAAWTDTFHAKEGMTLHGRIERGVIVVHGTYPAGDGPEWGWRIEIDARDPEHLALRMTNVEPSGAEQIAVDLRGAR